MIKKIFCVVLIFVSGLSPAKNFEPSPAQPKTARVKELVSSQGIKFWYHQDKSTPLVNIAIAFKNSGAAHMELTKRSVPSLYAWTVLCGSGKYSKEEFQERLQNISVKLYVNADFDHVAFFYKYPKIVSDEAINLFLITLNSPKFEKKEVEKKKQSLSYLLETYQNSPIWWYQNVMMPKMLFEDHPYRDGLGNAEDVLKLNKTDLKKFHEEHIVLDNVELCIFGDLSEDESVKLADKILKNISRKKESVDKIKDAKAKFQNFSQKLHYEGPQSYILFALPNILKPSEKMFAATVLYLILGGDSFKSKIMSKLRSDLGLIYGGGTDKIRYKHASVEIGFLQTSNKNIDSAISEIKSILKQLKEKGISQEELDFAKSNIKGLFLVGLRTAEDLCYFYMTKKLQGCSVNVLEEFLQGIDSVNLEQVNSVAKELLDENKLPIVVIGGKE